MKQQIKVTTETKNIPSFRQASLQKKAGEAFENVMEKVEAKTEILKNKVKESELALKAKDKFGELKESARHLFNKSNDKNPAVK